MTATRKSILEKNRQRTLTLPPEIDEFLDTLPIGQRSSYVVEAIRERREIEKLVEEYRPDGRKLSDWVIEVKRTWIKEAAKRAAVKEANRL